MFSNPTTTAEISINRPVAAVEALRGDKVNSKFVVGTSSVRASEDNHLLLLRFHSDSNHLGIDATLAHPTGPVEHIRTSPSDLSYILTTAEHSNESETAAATLWKIPSDVTDRTPTNNDYGDDLGDEDDDDYYNQDRGRSNNDDVIDSDNVIAMEERATLQASNDSSSNSGAKVVDVAWRGNAWDEELATTSTMGDVITLCSDGTLTQWDLAFGSCESTRRCAVNLNNPTDLSSSSRWNLPARMSWDPHHADIIAYSTGDIVQLIDWREAPSALSSSTTGIISEKKHLNGHPHHRYGITDLDYNPNKPNIIVTSGKDGLLKFWDLRKTGSDYYDIGGSDGDGDGDDIIINGVGDSTRKKKQRPVFITRGIHRHWTTCVSYNPFHDQLVLSGGTDSLVNLLRMSSISSAPLLTFDDDHPNINATPLEGSMTKDPKHQPQSEGPNIRVSRYEHMDSVTAIAWGAADAWIYISASFDGKVILNHVPTKEKYKILL
mmetsp:Transcript_30291/g.34779  ORF Transcript_30291/g.34779 Transcript_30291/m.34779 type:complete len:492 (+) Transcript_30291:79-1554(+)